MGRSHLSLILKCVGMSSVSKTAVCKTDTLVENIVGSNPTRRTNKKERRKEKMKLKRFSKVYFRYTYG